MAVQTTRLNTGDLFTYKSTESRGAMGVIATSLAISAQPQFRLDIGEGMLNGASATVVQALAAYSDQFDPQLIGDLLQQTAGGDGDAFLETRAFLGNSAFVLDTKNVLLGIKQTKGMGQLYLAAPGNFGLYTIYADVPKKGGDVASLFVIPTEVTRNANSASGDLECSTVLDLDINGSDKTRRAIVLGALLTTSPINLVAEGQYLPEELNIPNWQEFAKQGGWHQNDLPELLKIILNNYGVVNQNGDIMNSACFLYFHGVHLKAQKRSKDQSSSNQLKSAKNTASVKPKSGFMSRPRNNWLIGTGGVLSLISTGLLAWGLLSQPTQPSVAESPQPNTATATTQVVEMKPGSDFLVDRSSSMCRRVANTGGVGVRIRGENDTIIGAAIEGHPLIIAQDQTGTPEGRTRVWVYRVDDPTVEQALIRRDPNTGENILDTKAELGYVPNEYLGGEESCPEELPLPVKE